MILYDKRIYALKAFFFEQMPSKFAPPARQYVSSCILHRKLNQNHIFFAIFFLILVFLLVAKLIHGLEKIIRSFDDKKDPENMNEFTEIFIYL